MTLGSATPWHLHYSPADVVALAVVLLGLLGSAPLKRGLG